MCFGSVLLIVLDICVWLNDGLMCMVSVSVVLCILSSVCVWLMCVVVVWMLRLCVSVVLMRWLSCGLLNYMGYVVSDGVCVLVVGLVWWNLLCLIGMGVSGCGVIEYVVSRFVVSRVKMCVIVICCWVVV